MSIPVALRADVKASQLASPNEARHKGRIS